MGGDPDDDADDDDDDDDDDNCHDHDLPAVVRGGHCHEALRCGCSCLLPAFPLLHSRVNASSPSNPRRLQLSIHPNVHVRASFAIRPRVRFQGTLRG